MVWGKKRLKAPKGFFYTFVSGWPHIPELDWGCPPSHVCSPGCTKASLVVGHQSMFVELIS